MSIQRFWHTLSTDQIQLSVKEKALTTLTCFVAILLTGFVTHWFAQGQAPLLVASMGASAVILFVMPSSPLAQPWPFIAGQLLSAAVGVSTVCLMPTVIDAAATAVGLSVLLMLLLRCLHPPAAATALTPILVHDPLNPIDFNFVLMPVGINIMVLLGLAIILNRFILRRHYPAVNRQQDKKTIPLTTEHDRLATAYKQDILDAVAGFESFLDVSYTDLSRLFTQVHLLAYKRSHEAITCADIMLHTIVTVDYDTDVEVAWALMHEHHLKAMPVLDRARRVIGIVTHYDFLKYIKLTPYASFQEKFLAFIHKTPDLTTTKPEAVGHIMTRKVATLPASAHIADLVQFMSTNGHRYVPIVDAQQRFVGMIFQRDFIAALFHNKLISPERLHNSP